MIGEPIQVLLVEDDIDHTELIERSFELREDLRLTIVGSLEAARSRFGSAVPDVVIIDSLLPDGRGTELLPEFIGETCEVVMMTSYGDGAAKAEALAAGVSRYVVKTEDLFLELPDLAVAIASRKAVGLEGA